MEYERYPLVLRHPAYKPARKIADAVAAHPPESYFAQPEQWEAEKYPQVTVMTPDQEEYYTSKGYAPAGMPNAAAFQTAFASPHVAGRTTSEWPKMVNGVMMQDPNAPVPGPAEYPKYLTPPKGDPFVVQSAAEEQKYRKLWSGPGDDEDDEDDEVNRPVLTLPKKRRGRPPKVKFEEKRAE